MIKMKKPTINDVAKLANVSRGTISNYINGVAVRKENRVRIEKAIKQLDYIPNASARELKTAKNSTVVFIVPTIWTPFFSELVLKMQLELEKRDYKMILANSHVEGDTEKEIIQMASLNQVSGVITMSYSDIYRYEDVVKKLNLVSIERAISDDIPLITSNNFGGGELAAKKLVELGATKLLLLRRAGNHRNATDDRTEGFLNACEIMNIPVQVFEASLSSDYRREFVEYILSQFSEENSLFDGIFGVTDEYAELAYDAIKNGFLSTKKPIPIIGFDGSKAFETAPRRIYSIRQPVEKIVKESVDALMKMMEGNLSEKGYKRVLDVSVLEPDFII
jgi:putative transcriptional regulator